MVERRRMPGAIPVFKPMIPRTTGLLWLLLATASHAVMFNRDTGDSKSQDLADLDPFDSRANIPGCTAVLVAPNVLLSAAHCVNYASSGTVTATWNGQSRSGAAFTNIGADHIVIVTSSPFTGTTGKMTAPYSGNAENGRLVWKVASGGYGVIGYGGTGPFYDGKFRAMTNRIEVDNVSNPPNPVSSDWLFYDNDGPPSRPSRATTLYEGGTAPGDSGGPLYMFENGRWYVVGVTSGPGSGYYRDGRVRTDMGQIETVTGYTWARPVTPALEMRWVAQDLTSALAEGAAVTSWTRNGGADAWTNTAGDGGAGTAILDLAATPNGTAAVDFAGTARLGLAAASNPVANETTFTVAMVVRVDAAGAGTETNWFDNTGLLDAEESGVKNDWGLSVASTGKPGFGIGNTDTTQYSATNIADGQWRVIVATWDGSEITGDAAGNDRNMSLYVDSVTNVSRRQGAEFLNVGRTGVTLTLGGSRAASRFLDGAIAEVRLYRGALDETAVDSLIRELKHTHISPQLGLTLSKPATGRAALVLGHGLVIDGTATGAASVSITQTSGPGTSVISPSNALPAYVTFPPAGIYQLNVTATQGASSVVKPVLVEVLPDAATPPSSAPLNVGGSWTAVNIGDASTSGGLSTTATTMSLTGSGMGFEEVSDSLRYVWKPLTGDGSITGRVTGFSANNGGKAFGGLMLRSSLRRESSNVAATVISGGGLRFSTRSENGSYTEPDMHTLRAPYWVRVERVGNTFTGYQSADGVTWTQQGSPVTITMPASALWGLAVTSHAENSVSQTSFTNVSLEALGGQPAPSNTWTGADVGSPVPAGSHSGSGSSFSVNGGGSDIFGTADKFYFLSQAYSGDARLTARVTSQDRTDPWAKAGVMVRSSTATGAANAFMAVTPLNGLPWQSRATDGGSTATNTSGTANFAAPYWLRLTRSGSDFSCFRSTDGVNWSQLGPTRSIPDAPQTIHAGVVVSSINNSGNSVVNLDNLSIVENASSSVLPEILFAAGQNPSVSNNFTLTATSPGTPVWSWQKVSGPGDLLFRTQNSSSPQTAFTQEGTYVIRAIAETNGAAVFVDQTQNLRLDARWNFNTAGNAEGWSPFNATTTVANGILTGSATSTDPQISKSAAVYVSGSLAKHIVARYRGSATGTSQLFWGRVGAGGFSGSRVVNFPNYTPANSWQGILANPSANTEWAAREIIDFRFDPTGGSASTFDLDWLALSDGDFDDDGLPDLTEGGADTDNDGLPNFADLDSNGDGTPDGAVPPADLDGDGQPDALETVRYWNATPRSKSWQTAVTDWNTAMLGGGVQSAWNPGDDAVFDRAETYTVTLPGAMAPGRLTISAGQVTFDGTGSLNAREISVASGAALTGESAKLFTATQPASLMLNGTLAAGTTPNAAGRGVDLSGSGEMTGGTLRVNGGTFSGVVSGASALVKETGGTLVLTGNHTFTGASQLDGGTIQVGTGGTTGALGSAPFSGAGTLVFDRSDTLTWSGSRSGGGSLVKNGTNTLILTGNHTHSGGTTIAGGTLQIGDGGTTGSLNGGPVTSAGLIRFQRSDFSTCDASISGGTLSKLGAGTLVLSGNNSFGSGTLTLGGGTQNVGFLRLAHPKALGNYAKASLASNNTGVSGIEVTGGLTFNYGIDTAGRNSADRAILRNVSGNNTWAGAITITSTGGTYQIESLADELNLSGTVGVGSLSVGTRGLTLTGAGNIRMTGPLTDTAATPISLTKSGTGTLRLNATNTFTGAISATAGTFLINGSVTPAATVSAGAVLGGEGVIGSATLTGTASNNPAVLSPGDASIATLTSTGTVTFATHSRLRWEVGVLNPAVGDFDKLQASNLAITATGAAPMVIEIIPNSTEAGPAAAVFPIATASGSLTGVTASTVILDTSAFPSALGTWQVRQTGNTLELVYAPGGYLSWIAGFPGITDPAESADPDSDGWTNRSEWIAGTDPTNPSSRFTTTVVNQGLSFTRIPGRTYIVETTANLTNWAVHATVPSGSGPITIAPPVPAGAIRFYRVRIDLAE